MVAVLPASGALADRDVARLGDPDGRSFPAKVRDCLWASDARESSVARRVQPEPEPLPLDARPRAAL
jgi:hypothetical protein